MLEATVKIIPASLTWPLRHRVLRPHMPFEHSVYEADELNIAVHFGVFLGNRQVGTASLFNEPFPGTESGNCWRIRGMAVLAPFQRKGLGLMLLQECLNFAELRRGDYVWCNGRTGVVGFYARGGLLPSGAEFDLEGIGPHFLLLKNIRKDI